MRSIPLFTAVLAFGATTAWAQNAPAPAAAAAASTPLQLEVAVRGYAADDRQRSMAGDSATDRIEGYVWADRSLCTMGSGSAAPTVTPWVGWHFTGAVQGIVQESGRSAVTFRIEWQRTWDKGSRLTEEIKGVSSTSLREGERLELDRVTGGATEGCGTTTARLEVGSVARPAYRIGVLGGAPGARAGGRGAAAAPQAFGAAAAANKKEVAKLFEAVQLRAKNKSFFQLPGTYDAELWLVHRHPDGKETTELKKVQFTGADLSFTFPAVVLTTARGDLTLDFSGTLRAGVGPDATSFGSQYAWRVGGDPQGPRSFYFYDSATDPMTGFAWRPKPQTGRAPLATATSADDAVRIAVVIVRRARANFTPPLDTRGGSYFFMNVPAPNDVISFEFPSLPQGTEDLLKGHSFSLRIRVAPVAK